MSDQNVSFGEKAIRQGLVNESQLGECMAELQRLESEGTPKPLAQLMIERGLIHADQARALQEAHRLMHCKQCKKTYRVVISGDPPCKTCGGPMIDVTGRRVRPSSRRPAPSSAPPVPPPAQAPPSAHALPPRRKSSGQVQLPTPEPIAPRADPADHLVGQTFSDKYELLGRIGHGAMGAVYQARHMRLDRVCAIKILPQELACDPELMNRFKLEARTTARLEHINVIRVYEVDSDQGYEYLAMEYIEGVTLAQLMEQQPVLGWREAVDMVRQAAIGLGVAHAKNVIHRDIKPANLMLNNEGTVKVMDFGLARLAESGHASRSGTILGTPHFMSPEQARGDPVDHRTDIYSLGATLYNLVTGRTPFEAPNDFALLLKAMEEEPPLPHRVNPRLPEELSVVLQKMMAKDRELRYADMDEIVDDLARLLEGQSGALSALATHGTQQGEARTERVLQQRRRKLQMLYGLLALNLVLVIVAVALVYGGFFSSEKSPVDQPATVDEATRAYEGLTRYLLRNDVTAQEKAAACGDYLQQFPDSPKAATVREYLDRFRKQQETGATGPQRFPTGRYPKQAGPTDPTDPTAGLLRQLKQARENEDKVAGQRLLARLQALGADPLSLEEYQIWLSGKDPASKPGQLRPSMLVMLLSQIRDTLLEGKLVEAEGMIAKLDKAKGLTDDQRRELDALRAVLSSERKTTGELSPVTIARARAFLLRTATRSLDQGNPKEAARLLKKALRLTSDRKQQAPIYMTLARIAEQQGHGGEALRYHAMAWERGLRERGFVERYAWALFSRKQYEKALACIETLNADKPSVADRYLELIARFRAGQQQKARQLAVQLHQDGVPLPPAIVAQLKLMPSYADRLTLRDGTQLAGRLVASNEQTVTFRWREGRSTRFKVFDRSKVKSVSAGPLDAAGFARAMTKLKQKTRFELAGLLQWATLNGRPRSDLDRIEERIRFVRANARLEAGIACKACNAQGDRPHHCASCGGTGTIKSPCERCEGAGKQTCGKCAGEGRHSCPGRCQGQGFVLVKVKTAGGFREEKRRCGDCRGKREISCLRCRGSKNFPCGACRGKGSHSKRCMDCRGRERKPCASCGGRGVTLDAWTAFVIGVGHHLTRDDEGAQTAWQAMAAGSRALSGDRRRLILDQLPHLGLTDLIEKLGR